MTSMSRWNPLQEMQSLHHQFNRLFEPYGAGSGVAKGDWTSGTWVPPVDVEESGDKLILRAELPGFKPEDVEIHFENGVLTLRGERRFDNETNDRNFHRIERSYGTFVRSFTLPSTVNAENATARYEDGILELEMRQREEAKPRRITITAAKSNGNGNGNRETQQASQQQKNS